MAPSDGRAGEGGGHPAAGGEFAGGGSGEVVALVEPLQQAGWSIGDVALRGEDGGQVWVVVGTNGENQIRVEGTTYHEAWRRALDSRASDARWLTLCPRQGVRP